MTRQQRKMRELIIEGVREAVARALDRHKKLGEPRPVLRRTSLRCYCSLHDRLVPGSPNRTDPSRVHS